MIYKNVVCYITAADMKTTRTS